MIFFLEGRILTATGWHRVARTFVFLNFVQAAQNMEALVDNKRKSQFCDRAHKKLEPVLATTFMMSTMTNKLIKTAPLAGQWATCGGLVGSIAAFIGASCCVLPLILFNLGVSSAVIAQLGLFARLRDELLYVALALIAVGGYFTFRRRQKPPVRTLIMLCFAIALVSAAYLIPLYERDLLVLFGFRG